MAAATFDELVQACAGVNPAVSEDAMFLVDQQRKGATTAQATAEWATTLKARVDTARQERKPPGVEPLEATSSSTGSGGGSAYDEFFAIVKGLEDKGLPRPRALSRAVAEHPALHKAMLEEANEGRRRE